MKSVRVKITAALLAAAAFVPGGALACEWLDGKKARRTVAESPILAESVAPDQNAIVRLDENGEPILPTSEPAE